MFLIGLQLVKKNKMKNLSILISSMAEGGAERVVSLLLNDLKSEFNILLVLMSDKIFYDIPKDIKVVYIDNANVLDNGIKKLLKLPILGMKYKKVCQKYDIDVSLSFTNRPNYINIISKLFGNKSSILVSERAVPSSVYQTNSYKDKVSRFMIRYLYPKANLIIPNSLGIKYDLINKFSIESTIKVIHNPIDLKKIELQKNTYIEFDFSRFTFITIGRLYPQKNQKLLIEAFSKVNNTNSQLIIIGDGVLKSELENKIDILGLNNRVYLLGKQKNPYKYLSKANCFILSSDYEGFPNVLLEALACELPIISTDCPSGPREILSPSSDSNFQLKNGIDNSEYGVLTPVNDKINLTKAMNSMMNDERLLNSYNKTAKNRVSNFSKEKIIKQFIEIINKYV